MNRCKNCKYFKRNIREWENKKYGKCENDKFIYDVCLTKKEEKIIEKGDAFLYADYESYSASFEVGKDFGCIHFSNKEE